MKKKFLLILGLSLLISSCNISTSSSSESFSSSHSSENISSSSNNATSSSENIVSSSEMFSSSESSIDMSIDCSFSDDELLSLTIDSSCYYNLGSYSTNYDTNYVGGYSFGHYRANEPSGDAFISLVPYSSYVDDGTQEGSFYNISPIYGIRYITITYKTNLINSNNPQLSFGDDFSKPYSIDIESSKQEVTNTYFIPDGNFFEIDTNDNRITIYSIDIKYTNIKEHYHSEEFPSGHNDYRLNPVQVSKTLVPGQTTVEVPIKVEYTTNGYNVLETKEYTYYTYDYIVNNPDLALDAALIDPMDIAAYYNSFKAHPVNYVTKKNYNNAKTLFGNKTRCISTYTRTDGYATAVPWQKQPSKNSPLYHELDLDIDGSYSKDNRGSGRLVVWYYGFTSDGYDDSPVSVFTNDHYATFQEYMNDGTFGTKFNAEMVVTNYKFSPAITKN